MIHDKDERQMLQELMLENQRLLTENNELLKKLRKTSIFNLWLKLIWISFLIGLPFVLYYFVIEPWFESFGSSYETFEQGLRELPGWKQFYESADGGE